MNDRNCHFVIAIMHGLARNIALGVEFHHDSAGKSGVIAQIVIEFPCDVIPFSSLETSLSSDERCFGRTVGQFVVNDELPSDIDIVFADSSQRLGTVIVIIIVFRTSGECQRNESEAQCQKKKKFTFFLHHHAYRFAILPDFTSPISP